MSREWDEAERAMDEGRDVPPRRPPRETPGYFRCRRFDMAPEEARRMAEEAWDTGELADAVASDGIRRGLPRGAIIEAVAQVYGDTPGARGLAGATYDIAVAKFRAEFLERNPDIDTSPLRPRKPLDPPERPAPFPDYDPEDE